MVKQVSKGKPAKAAAKPAKVAAKPAKPAQIAANPAKAAVKTAETAAKPAKAAAKPATAAAKPTKTTAKPATAVAATAAAATAPRAAKPAQVAANGSGTKAAPWQLSTAPGTSAFTAYRDDEAGALVVRVGATELRYQLRCLDDLHAMLAAHGDWVPLGGADEQKPAADGTVEAWGRDAKNPVGGWYGLKKGLRGRFGVYVPPVLEALGRVELEHAPKNNRVRAR